MRLNNKVLSIFHGSRIAKSISLKMEIHLSASFSAKAISNGAVNALYFHISKSVTIWADLSAIFFAVRDLPRSNSIRIILYSSSWTLLRANCNPLCRSSAAFSDRPWCLSISTCNQNLSAMLLTISFRSGIKSNVSCAFSYSPLRRYLLANIKFALLLIFTSVLPASRWYHSRSCSS